MSNNEITPESEDIAIEALTFAMQIPEADDLRVLLSSLVSIINERPNLSATEYFQALKQVAANRSFIG